MIADTGNHRVRIVGSDGKITPAAGDGTKDFSGDGGAAITAQLSGPAAAAVLPGGDVLIADSGNDRVRLVTAGLTPTGNFVVNSTDSGEDQGGCQPAPGDCSLAEAITAANATAIPDRITFSIGLGGEHTITLPQSLPWLAAPVDIDGRTQPGYTDHPLVEITGPPTGPTLRVIAPSTIRGLALNGGFTGITLEAFSGPSTIQGNYIGMGPDGQLPKDDSAGIDVYSSGNTIGGDTRRSATSSSRSPGPASGSQAPGATPRRTTSSLGTT